MSSACVCGHAGGLVARKIQASVEYRGVDGWVAMYYHECHECGSELATREDMTANKDEMMCYKKAVDKQLDGV